MKILLIISICFLTSCVGMSDRNSSMYKTWILSQALDTVYTEKAFDKGYTDVNPLIRNEKDLLVVKGITIGLMSGLLYLVPNEKTREISLWFMNLTGWGCVVLNEKQRRGQN